jgi:hypothetical protein
MCACFASRGTKKRNGSGKGNIGSCDQLLECELIFHKSSFCTSIKKKKSLYYKSSDLSIGTHRMKLNSDSVDPIWENAYNYLHTT